MSSWKIPFVLAFVLLTGACGRLDYRSHEFDGSVANDTPAPFDASMNDLGVEVMPGFIVTPTTGLLTSEVGTTASFSVRLATAPVAAVTIAIASSDASEAIAIPSTLAFTVDNWNAPQLVTVTGVDDPEQDGNQSFTIVTAAATSDDADYHALDVPDVTGTNLDDETPGIIVTPSAGLITTEAGGSATFSVSLQSAPTADVTIPILSTSSSEGTVTPASVTFSPATWSSAQVVTVTGVDDAIADGDIAYVVQVGPSSSAQSEYTGLNGSDVMVTNEDDESAHLVISPSSGLVTTEAGGTATFTVELGSEPNSPVTLSVVSTTSDEGVADLSTLVFTASDWSNPQTVTVTGVDDAIVDGDQAYEIHIDVTESDDVNYAALVTEIVSLTNVDDESAGITVLPTAGLVTSEGGATATFTIVLNSEPEADVEVALDSDTPSEGTASPTAVTFTAFNWDIPQLVTVTGIDDSVADGTRAYSVVTSAATSLDGDYAGLNPADVTISNLDNDTAGVTVVPMTGLTTTEGGGSATFTVVLNVAPELDVSLSLSSSDVTEGTVTPSTLTFTPLNWSTPQTVTVTGVDDFAADGGIDYTIVTSATVSGSALYNALPVSDVTVTNTDDDVAGVVVMPTSGLVTTEAGGTATFSIVLTSQPSSTVSINLASSNAMEGSASPASLMFTTVNWASPQVVTVTGVNDFVDDGDVAYDIVTSAVMSSDGDYAGLTVSDVSLTNTDNDTAGVTVTPTTGLITTEQAATTTFTIVLNSQPTADVSIALSSSNTMEGTVSPASATFTSMNWSTPQTITVTGVNDLVFDVDVAYSIVTSNASSSDPVYNAVAVNDVSVTNQVWPTYIKASNTDAGDQFGYAIALSNDGNTLAVGARSEASGSRVINAGESDNSAALAGAVYIFVRSGSTWSQQAYLKPLNTDAGDQFGTALAISADGNTLAAGALAEGGGATGVDGNAFDNSRPFSGAAHVFRRTGTTWAQEAYIKASNAETGDTFGGAVSLSADGNTLVVGAQNEASNALGVGGNQADNSRSSAGAAYVFVRSGVTWSQQAYLKTSVIAAFNQFFGISLKLADDGNTLAVFSGLVGPGALEIFTRTGVAWTHRQRIVNPGGDEGFGLTSSFSADATVMVVGSVLGVYTFARSGMTYTQEGSVTTSSNYESGDTNLVAALSADGTGLLLGVSSEDSAATRVNGNQADNSATASGAAYTLSRSGMGWTPQLYLKPSNTRANQYFGAVRATAVNAAFNVAAFGASGDSSNATGINGNQTNTLAASAGAVFVY